MLKRREHEAGEQETLMGLIMDEVMDAIVATNEDEQIVLFNKAAEAMFGVSASAVLGQPVDQFIPQRFREAHHQAHREFAQDDHSARHMGVTREVVGLRASGEEFPAEVTISRVEMKGKGKTKRLFTVVLRDVSDRHQAQALLMKEQQFISAILNTTAALVVILDADWKIQRINQACQRIVRYSEDDLKGQFFSNLLVASGEDDSAVREFLSAHRQRQFPDVFECALVDKERHLRWIHWISTAIRDTAGQVEFVIVTGTDITDRKTAELKLQKEQEFISAVLDTTGALVVVLDEAGNIVRFNRACQELSGFSWEEVCGDSVWETLVPQEERSAVESVFNALWDGQASKTHVNHWVTKKKEKRLIAWTNTVMSDVGGNLPYVIATGLDITEQRKAEQALQESQERFNAFMDHTPTLAFLKDEKGCYLFVNHAFEEHMNLPFGGVLGKTDAQLFPADIAQTFQEHDREVLGRRKVLETEETTVDERSQVRYWLVLKFPVYERQGQVYLGGVALDITERKLANLALEENRNLLDRQQGELQALAAQLLTAQEEERRRISRELHDDVNQRLALVSLHVQSALQMMAKADPVRQTLSNVDRDLAKLSDDLRHLAAGYHPSILDDLGLEVAVRSLIAEVSQVKGLSIDMRAVNVPKGLSPNVATCLYRILQESLQNTLKHADASNVYVELLGNTTGITLSIRDDGTGFHLESRQPQGLGLVSMRERIRQVGGDFRLESQPGAGTMIAVWVPVGASSPS